MIAPGVTVIIALVWLGLWLDGRRRGKVKPVDEARWDQQIAEERAYFHPEE